MTNISFTHDNKEFVIESTITGRETILLNGKVVSEKRNLTNLNSVHQFSYEGQNYELKLGWNMIQRLVHVTLTGNSQLLHDQDFDLQGKAFDTQKMVIPKWSYLFIVLCIMIPFIARGGALPFLIGILGMGGCIKVSRKSTFSNAKKLAICAGITALCWLSLVFLVLVLAVLRVK